MFNPKKPKNYLVDQTVVFFLPFPEFEREMEMGFEELKEAIEKAELVDAHAHNIVALDSSFPFIGTFSEATGDALSFAPHSLSFKVRRYHVSHQKRRRFICELDS